MTDPLPDSIPAIFRGRLHVLTVEHAEAGWVCWRSGDLCYTGRMTEGEWRRRAREARDVLAGAAE